MKRAFTDWQQTEVEDYFNINLVFENETLNNWITVDNVHVGEEAIRTLEKLRKKASIYITTWNEDELTAYFISNILALVDFNQIQYSGFINRPVGITFEELELNGKIDFMVAMGRGVPKKPFFFLQVEGNEIPKEIGKFKPEKPSGDAIAQALLAMLFAQKENADNQPIYGGYINGRNWHFMILENNNYCISEAYVSTKSEDLQQIYRILMELKNRINLTIKG